MARLLGSLAFFLPYILAILRFKLNERIIPALQPANQDNFLTEMETSNATQAPTSEPMNMDTDNGSSSTSTSQPKFQQVFEIFSWDNTQRNLSITPPLSSRIPPAANANSAFLDVQKMPTTLDGREVAEALPENAIGVKFRADTKFIQIFFEKEEQANAFINQGQLETDNLNIPILPPKGKLPPRTLLKLDNIPIMGKIELEQ